MKVDVALRKIVLPSFTMKMYFPDDWESGKAMKPNLELLCTLPMAGVPTGLATLAPDQSIACLCHHGARSQQVAMFLERQGFTRVANIAGGIDAWSLQCDPTVPRY